MKYKLDNIIQKLTHEHIEILRFFKNPEIYLKKKSIEFNQSIGISCLKKVLIKSFPDKDISMLKNIVEHLMDLDLIDCPSLETSMTLSGVLSPRITCLGETILKYVDIGA